MRSLPLIAILILTLTGCRSVVQEAAFTAGMNTMDSVTKAVEAHPDPRTVALGLPAYMLLIDGMIVQSPENPELLLAGSQLYGTYAQAFLMAEDEQGRAGKLYGRGKAYGLRLLRRRPFFAEAAESTEIEVYEQALQRFGKADVPHLHAAASAWLGWVIANADSMAALADLPRVLALMRRVLELDPDYGDGSVHLVFAVYNVIQPRGAGQDLDKAEKHFQRAIELAGDRNLLPRVLYAEFMGEAKLDPELFTEQLEYVLAVEPAAYPRTRLYNELAHDRARTLLDKKDEIF